MKGEMEMMMEEGDMSWLDMVDRNSFVFSTVAVGFVALAMAAAPTLMWWLYIEPQAASMSITKTTQPNYYNAWYAMWIGNLIAFVPPVIMFWPAYFNGTAATWYGIAWAWAEKAGGVVGLITMIAFMIEAINTGLNQTATKSIWLSIWLYIMSNVVAEGIGMKFSEEAKLWYAWPYLEAMKDQTENGGEANELDDTATELLANFF